MATELDNPFPYFTDRKGDALDQGYIFIGTANQDPELFPIDLFWDEELTIPAAQPLRTDAGYVVNPDAGNSPARVYYEEVLYSIRVRDRHSTQIIYVAAAEGPLGQLTGPDGSDLIGFLQAGTGAVQRQVQDKLRDEVNFLDYATSAERADILSFNRAASSMAATFDEAVAATLAVDTRYARSLTMPAGVVTGALTWPSSGAGDTRWGGYRLHGAGRGEAFIPAANQRGTIFYSSDDSQPTLTFQKYPPGLGSGALDVGDFRVEGTQATAIPALDFGALFGSSRAEGIDVYQNGVGDGVRINNIATGSYDFAYSINKDWLTNGLGLARTGAGYYLLADTDCGLAQVTKATSRGWSIGFRFGEQGAAARLLLPLLSHSECSVVNNGVVINDTCQGAVIDSVYFEGVETACVIDRGQYSSILQPWCPLAPIGLDLSNTLNGGTNVRGGVVSMPAVGGMGITINASTGMKNVWGTSIVYPFAFIPGSTSTGMRIAGADPRGFLLPDFAQQGPWVATAKKLDDISTSASYPAAATGGLVGAGPYEDLSGRVHYSWDRGAIRLHVDPVEVTQTAVSGGVLTLKGGSVYILNFSVPTTVSSIVCERHPDKTLVLINRNGNLTLQNSSLLLIRERTGSWTAPANGSVHLFQAIPGGLRLLQELFRTSNEPRTYTVATLPSASTAAAGARAFVSDANGTTFAAAVAGGGANNVPVYSDGTTWRIG